MTSSRLSDVITISDPTSHMTPDSPLQFFKPRFNFSCSAYITILCQFRIQHTSRFCTNFDTILCQFHVQHASQFRTKIGTVVPIFVLGPELHFRPCPDLPKFNVTKVMDHNRSYTKCHLQPYKRFLQMTCNCGTPLIHISHA